MNPGETFLLSTPPHGKHLFVVAVPITIDSYLLIPIVSSKDHLEKVCVIKSGNGVPDFISHESIVDYRNARRISKYTLEDMKSRGLCSPKGKFSETIHLEILEAALISKRISKQNKNRIRLFLNN